MMAHGTGIRVTLPGGLWLDGARVREAELRPVAGVDEAFLLEAGDSLPPARRATALLSRCLTALGPLSTVTEDGVRSLAVGDREALLLHLRRLTLGDRLQCVLDCPHSDCGAKMDLELKVSDLLLPPYRHLEERYEVAITENGTSYRVHFRLPTGADQEAAANLALDDPPTSAELLLRRCVESVTSEGDDGEPLKDWPPAVAHQLPAILSELDPQAELTLELACPVCDHGFSTTFDTAAFVFEELAGRSKYLYREVHQLAFYYHWSESEIMAMTARKRRRYLDLLTEALEEGRR